MIIITYKQCLLKTIPSLVVWKMYKYFCVAALKKFIMANFKETNIEKK